MAGSNQSNQPNGYPNGVSVHDGVVLVNECQISFTIMESIKRKLYEIGPKAQAVMFIGQFVDPNMFDELVRMAEIGYAIDKKLTKPLEKLIRLLDKGGLSEIYDAVDKEVESLK